MLSKMRRHLISHGIDNQHPCPLCEKVLTSENSRRKHIQRVHKKALSFKEIRMLPPFRDQCQTPFISYPITGYEGMSHPKFSYVQLSEQLFSEGIITEVEDGILCLRCGQTRKMLSKMRVHLISHGIDNQHPCPFCEKVLTSENNRRKHITVVHKKALSFKHIRLLPPFQDQQQTQHHPIL